MSYKPTTQELDQYDKEIAQENSAKAKRRQIMDEIDNSNLMPNLHPAPLHSNYSFLHDLGAQTANSFINIANIPHDIGMINKKIPTIPHGEGWGSMLGSMAGYLIPGLAGEKIAGSGLRALSGVLDDTAMGERANMVREDFPKRAKAMMMTGRGLRSAGVQAGVGAATSPSGQRESGAISGGAGGLAGEAIGSRISKLIKASPEKVVANSLRPLQNHMQRRFSELIGNDNGNAALREAYNKAQSKGNNWFDAENTANLLHNRKAKFSNLFYNQTYRDILNELNNDKLTDIGRSPKIAKQKNAILNLLAPLNPTKGKIDFKNLISMKKNVNELADWDKDLDDKGNNLLKSYSNRLGDSLDKGLKRSKVLNATDDRGLDLIDQLDDQWNKKRKDYARLQKFFINPRTGKSSSQLKRLYHEGEWQKILDHYALDKNEGSDAQKTTFKVRNLNELLGDPHKAQAVLLQKSIPMNQDGVDIQQFAKNLKDKKVSPHILNNILTKTDRNVLHYMTYAKAMNDSLKNNSKSRWAKFALRFLGGAAVGHVAGASLPDALALGAGYGGLHAGAESLDNLRTMMKAKKLVHDQDWEGVKKLMKKVDKSLSSKPIHGIGSTLGGMAGQKLTQFEEGES